MGILQRRLQEDEAALTNFEKALSLDPQLLDAFVSMVGVYAARKDFDTALAKCNRKLTELKKNPSAAAIIYNLKGQLFLAQKKVAQSEESFQAALKADPDYSEELRGLALRPDFRLPYFRCR